MVVARREDPSHGVRGQVGRICFRDDAPQHDRHPAEPARTRETRLIRATRSNVRGVTEWIGTIRPQGRSNPIPALEIAAVVLLLGAQVIAVYERRLAKERGARHAPGG